MRRLRSLRRDENGQALFLLVAFIFVIVVFLITIPNVTRVVGHKMRTQTAADAASLAAVTWVARGMNIIQGTNYGIVAMYADIALDAVIWMAGAVLYFAPLGTTPAGQAINRLMFDAEPPYDPIQGLEGLRSDITRLIDGAVLLSRTQDAIRVGILEYAQEHSAWAADSNLAAVWDQDQCKAGAVVFADVDELVLETPLGLEQLLGPFLNMMGFVNGIGGVLFEGSRASLRFENGQAVMVYKIPRYYRVRHTYREQRYYYAGIPPRRVYYWYYQDYWMPQTGWVDTWDARSDPLGALAAARDRALYYEPPETPPGQEIQDFDYLGSSWERVPGSEAEERRLDERREELGAGVAMPRSLNPDCSVQAVAYSQHPTTEASTLSRVFEGSENEVEQFAFSAAELVHPDGPLDPLYTLKISYGARLCPLLGDGVLEKIADKLEQDGAGHGFRLDELVKDSLINH